MLAKIDKEGYSTNQLSEVDYQVVHTNERRIRVCISRLSKDSEYARRLKQVIESLHFVTDVRINPAASSLAIEYEAKGVPSSSIQEKILSLVQQVTLGEKQLSLNLAANELKSKVAASPTNQWQKVEYKVVHQNQRRIRVCVPRLAEDAEYARKLKYLVESIDGVTLVRINPAAKSIAVEYDDSVSAKEIGEAREKLFEAIQQAPLAEIDGSVQAQASSQDVNYWERLGLPAIGLGVALLAGPVEVSIPFLVIGGLIAGAGLPIFRRAIAGIVDDRKIKVDVLDSLWISLQTLQGQYVAPALMVSLVEAAEAVRDMSAGANDRQILELLDFKDRYAWVERDGQKQIPLNEVQKGDKVIVYPGELIPVDGRILYGTALIDEHSATGKATLVTCTEGQEVYASTLVVKGKVCIIAERTGKETRAALVAQFLKAAPVADTQAGDYVKEVSDRLVAPTLLLSGSIFALTGNISTALAPLQLDFGTGIGIAVPATILAALTSLARSGVFIRNGRALEALARVDTVVFGKTGTLTEAIASVVGIQTTDVSISTAEVLTLAASVEQELNHPVAKAILRYAEENGVRPRKCKAWDYQVGMGVSARVGGHKILVGSQSFLEQEGVNLAPIHRQHPNLKKDTHSLVYVARDGKLMGVILLDNPLRPESASAIETLSSQSINHYLLAGDDKQVVHAVATQLGIDANNTYGSALPEQKIEIIRQLHNQGKTVAYVGDELSDTEALAYADVSVSFAKGTDLEGETADVVLIENDLRGLIHAIDIAKRTMDMVYQNIGIVAVPNISVVIAGVFFGLDPVAAVLINNCAALIAELNGSRSLVGTFPVN